MNTNAVLAGHLKFLNLGDVLQLLGSNGVSGVLRIMSQYAQEPGVIYLDKGNPVHALCIDKAGLEAILALFGWIDGEFEFQDETVSVQKTITKNRMEIILEGLRMLDDGQIPKLGPDSVQDVSGEQENTAGGLVIKGPLVDYMDVIDEEEFEDGRPIVTERSHGNWIWVIMEGLVDVVKQTPEEQIKILTLSSGSFIGSIQSFKLEGNVRSATTVARGRVHLAVLDTQRLATEFSSLSKDFKDFFTSLDRRLREVTKLSVDIYQKTIDLDAFMKDKHPMVKQGEQDDTLVTITEGEAFVVRKTAQGHVPLAHLKKGDFIGRVPFLNLGHEPDAASVFAAKDDIRVQPLNPEHLIGEYERLSHSFKNIITNLSSCISATTDVACEFSKSRNEIK